MSYPFKEKTRLEREREIARAIADKIAAAEVLFCRACGYGWTDCYLIGWAEGDIAYRMLMGPAPRYTPEPVAHRIIINRRP